MARYFPGLRSAYLKITESVDLSFYPCTLSAWVKYDSGGIGDGTIFSRYQLSGTPATTHDDALAITVATSKVCGRGLRSGGGGSYRINIAGTADTNWHHLASVLYGNGHRSFYYDGVFIGTNVTGLATQFLNAWGVGAEDFQVSPPTDVGGNVLKGAVADCAVWTTSLSPYEISQLASKQVRPGQIQRAQLKGWWPLTQGGDLNSVVPYLPFTLFGAVTEVADPPSLPPITVTTPEYERHLSYVDDAGEIDPADNTEPAGLVALYNPRDADNYAHWHGALRSFRQSMLPTAGSMFIDVFSDGRSRAVRSGAVTNKMALMAYPMSHPTHLTPISITAWVQTTHTGLNTYLGSYQLGVASGILCRMNYGTAGAIAGAVMFQWVDPTPTLNSINSTMVDTGVTDGKMHFIAMSYAGAPHASGAVRIWVDGREYPVTQGGIASGGSWSQPDRILISPEGDWMGWLGEWRYYNRALTGPEVIELYRRGQGRGPRQ